MASKAADAWQGLLGLIGITLGVIPLVMLVVGSRSGLWSLVLDESAGTLRWVCPLAVLAVCLVLIAILERRKH